MSVNGRIIPSTPLAVDFWQLRKCPSTRLFFLSHLHSDHTVGLTSTWTNRPIYCSPVTRTLLTLKLQVKEKWIHPLELGEPHLLPLDDIGKEKLTVTLMDANHCPGSVMFLFEGYFGTVLYTGDFRYVPAMLREIYQKTSATIDVLYLDNTNCDPNRSLPTRKQATQQIKEIIRSHPDHNVVIGLYSLGKESLLVDLAMEFKTWIEVSFDRMETVKALALQDVFTTELGAGRIRAVNQSQITSANLRRWDAQQPTLAILPTSRPVQSFHANIHIVPYSDHSSFQELEDFVSALAPTTLVPIVGRGVPESLLAFLPSGKDHEFLVPESVQGYMSSHSESTSLKAATVSRKRLRPLLPKGVIFEASPSSSQKRRRRRLSSDMESLRADDSEAEQEPALVLDLARTLNGVMDSEVFLSTGPDDESAESVSSESCSSSHGGSSAAGVDPSRTPRESNGTTHGCRSDSSEGQSDASVSKGGENSLRIRLDQESSFLDPSRELLQRIEQIENEILKNLPFTEDDFKRWGPLDKSLLEQFPLCP